MKRLSIAVCLAISMSLACAAEHQHAHHEYREHGAHVHGVARLDLAQEGQEVLLALASPAANIVGFEQAPRNETEREALATAITKLEKAARLFQFPAAAHCRLEGMAIDAGLEHEEGHEAEHEHADISAEYQFHCDQPNQISPLRVQLFEFFPNTHELRVRFITGKGQGARELTPSSSVLWF